MNLVKLFELQKQADERWKDEPNRLEKDILWLFAELGELMNEWAGFKYRYPNQQPRTDVSQSIEWNKGKPDYFKLTSDNFDNPLLEEYTDCLQVIMSIGLQDSSLCVYDWDYKSHKRETVIEQFNVLYWHASPINEYCNDYERFIELFIGLGEMLNLSWQDIERTFIEKHERNKERQGMT